MRKVLVINGHPDPDSFNQELFRSYLKGARKSEQHVDTLIIRDLVFDPDLQFGYRKRTELEPDLIAAWEKIKWADHLVWIHPVWWGGVPALMKGFIDRVFLPGRAFQHRSGSLWWDGLLKGRTAHIITTLDQPAWYYWLGFGRPSVNQLKRSTLKFCGVSPIKVTYIGPIRGSAYEFRRKWLKRMERFGGGW
jgi:putative NADPH-quinone reductase